MRKKTAGRGAPYSLFSLLYNGVPETLPLPEKTLRGGYSANLSADGSIDRVFFVIHAGQIGSIAAVRGVDGEGAGGGE